VLFWRRIASDKLSRTKFMKVDPDSKAYTKKNVVSYGSFVCLAGMSQESKHYALDLVLDHGKTLAEMKAWCENSKKLQGVREMFAKVVGCKTFEEAQEMYPNYSTDVKLEPFVTVLNLGPKGKDKAVPQVFQRYCNNAVRITNRPSLASTESIKDGVKYFKLATEKNTAMEDGTLLYPIEYGLVLGSSTSRIWTLPAEEQAQHRETANVNARGYVRG
jgi:hypothetical protein